MKQLLLSGLAIVGLLPAVAPAQSTRVLSAAGQTVTYTNNGTVINPQIDALNVVNHGTFLASTIQPFETYSTVNFTNTGIMQGIVGWRFNNSSPTTPSRKLSANFVNFNPGYVQALDFTHPDIPPSGSLPCLVTPVTPSFLWIFATNIVTGAGTSFGLGASLGVGANGELRLLGTNVNLARSGLEVLPVWSAREPHGEIFILENNQPVRFRPDIAIYDVYWAQAAFTAQNSMNSAALWNGFTATAPTVGGTPAGFSIVPIVADSFITVLDTQDVTFTNFMGSPTNVTGTFEVEIEAASEIAKGAVFIATTPGAGVTHGFSQVASGLARVDAQVSIPFTNVVTGLPEFAQIFISDTLGPGDRGTIGNVIGCPTNGTARPLNYDVNWSGLPTGLLGNNGVPEPDFFISGGAGDLNTVFDGLTNANQAVITAGDWAAYSPFLDNVASRPQNIPAGTFTNLPGRVRITAENLDLTRTRIRGEGEIMISASHLVSSTNTVIDCENLRFNIASTNGSLRIQNLTKDTVARLRGPLYLWSAVWENSVTVIFTNNFSFTNVPIIDPNDPNGTNILGTNVLAILAPITNTVDVTYQITIIDASRVSTVLPVNVFELVVRNDNVIVDDNVTLLQKLVIDGRNFTLNGTMSIPGLLPTNPITGLASPGIPLLSWTAANAPNLENFTNNGTLSIPRDAHFGDDRLPYNNFINRGVLISGGLSFNSDYVEIGGQLIALNALFGEGLSGKFENGSSAAGNIARYTFGDLKLNQYQMVSGGAVSFSVTNSLSDAGPGSGNVIQTQDGFHLLVKPAIGDLLGTTIQSVAPLVPSVQHEHTWAGENRGPTSAGYLNNAAVGVLQLMRLSPDPLFIFSGTGAQNALYVDLLDLSTLTDYTNQLFINDNLVIYYAAADLSFTPPGSLTPEEFLDGKFGGRLRWVRTFAGANSSVPVVIGSQTFQINSALFNSQVIDSDGDGTPNFFDTTPFSTPPVDPPGSFIPPFQASVGSYSGLFYESSGIQLLNSGAFSATTTKKGGYSAKLQIGQQSYSFSGKFTTNGTAAKSIRRQGASQLTVSLQMDTTDNGRITGIVADGIWTATLEARRSAFSSSANPAPFAGKYTILLPGDGTAGSPSGDSYGALKVNSGGKVKFSGTLADGTKLSHAGSLSAEGRWPVYSRLYNKKGRILGWLNFTNAVAEDLKGWASWIKPPASQATYYPGGFNLLLPATGSAYDSSVDPIYGFSNGLLTLTEGNLSAGVTNALAVGPDNQVIGDNNLTIRLTESDGIFRGSIVDPVTSETIRFNGVILQKQGIGSGYFLGTDQSGRMSIGP